MLLVVGDINHMTLRSRPGLNHRKEERLDLDVSLNSNVRSLDVNLHNLNQDRV